ncbi:hypothetical protein [Leptolyngbya sp. Cla-17]|nr:hypothetical protein [Leptolyngbya sp. Cla-17]
MMKIAAIEALQRGFPHLIDQVRTGRAEFFGGRPNPPASTS